MEEVADHLRSGRLAVQAYSAVVLLLSGCSGLGPVAIQAGRNHYNVAIERTNAEQLLLNLVRLRYLDTPLFLQLTSVSTQFNLNATARADFSLKSRSSDADELGVGAGIGYAETPTVTYTPLQGEEFVQRILQPVRLETILLLYRSGWGIDRILRLCVQQMNGIPNAPSAAEPIPIEVPTYVDFIQAAKLLRALQVRDVLDMGYEIHDGRSVPVLRITSRALDWPEVRQIQELLGLAPGRERYDITTDIGARDPRQLAIATRSVLGIGSYLSQSVEVPRHDQVLGKVAITRDETGEPFDWNELLGDLFQVSSQPERPSEAAVAVYYRGSWFYIEDVDLDAKATFLLLSQLFALQAGPIQGAAPILTLPVGR